MKTILVPTDYSACASKIEAVQKTTASDFSHGTKEKLLIMIDEVIQMIHEEDIMYYDKLWIRQKLKWIKEKLKSSNQ